MRNLSGIQAGRLTVERFSHKDKWGSPHWECRCICGKEIVVVGKRLLNGQTKSCGCFGDEHRARSSAASTHGHTMGGTSGTYHSWVNVNIRCLNPAHPAYKYYGGRGISVCDRWRKGNPKAFENFLADMGPRPDRTFTIGRIDPDGDYEPTNCSWSDKATQARNTRANLYLEAFGRRQTLSEWAREMGLNTSTLCLRLKTGWNLEEALTTKAILGGNYEHRKRA